MNLYSVLLSWKKSFWSVAIGSIAITLLASCGGDDGVTEINNTMGVVENIDDLPECSKDNEGEQAFVRGESSARICIDEKWFATTSNEKDTVYIEKSTLDCTTKELKDKSGVKIVCGGDSVGVVLNGKDGSDGSDGKNGTDGKNGKDGTDGKNGADGKDGSSCTVVTLKDNSGLKVVCGGDSVGVVLNGKDGSDGSDGKNGTDGKNGKDGANGSNGKDGSGCTLAQQGNVVTIKCGDKSTTIDLGTEENPVDNPPVVLDSEKIAISLDEVSGVTQKGPFLSGSRILVREMEDGRTLTQTGNSFNGKILNDNGEFRIKARMLVSQYVMLEASGYYRNEITGENSSSELTLFAITDVNQRNVVNVNLLTHLEYERVIYLVTQKKMKVNAAKKQAQKEVLNLLHIDATDFSNSEDLNIAGASDEDAALLAFSVIMQGDRSVSQLSELLTKIAIDMEEDGAWNNATKRVELADWAADADASNKLSLIRNNVTSWKLSSVVPNFEKHIRHFWNTEYGLGDCTADSVGKVKSATAGKVKGTDTRYECVDSTGIGYMWRVASDYEKDTYEWTKGKDGDCKYGNINKKLCYVFDGSEWRLGNTSDCSLGLRGCTVLRQDTVGLGSDKVWHICDAKVWRNATTYEKDTFDWKNGTDGEIKKGNVTDSVYVFDKTLWRATSNVEGKLGGCVSAIADSVGKVGSTYYICKSGSWTTATALEYDTYRWATGKDGDSKVGSVNANNCYVFENKAWRSGNTSDCLLNLRGCTSLRQDTVGLGSDKVWHICDSKSWRNATTYEKDTFGWTNGADGEIKKGNVTDTVYVFDKSSWRATTNVEAKLGGCISAIADSVGKVGSTYYICTPRKWVEATALQYDTYKWAAGKDGDSKVGSVNANYCYVYENKAWRSGNTSDCSLGLRGCTALRQDTVGKGSDKVWHICDSKSWRKATTYEKDTFGWTNGIDGEIKKGNVTDSIYVFDKSSWRATTNVEAKLGGCVSAIADSVGKVGSTYYICNPRKWIEASVLQYDTYKQKCTEDGKMFNGNVNTATKYVCDGGLFRAANALETAADSACTSYNRDVYYILPKVIIMRYEEGEEKYYDSILSVNKSYYKCTENGWIFNVQMNQGFMTDLRDKKIYKTITIGTQTWMAENLNYVDSANYSSMLGKNWCMDDLDSCSKYGRYYTWSATIDSVYWVSRGKTCGCCGGWSNDEYHEVEDCRSNEFEKYHGICPDGWRLPTRTEYHNLHQYVRDYNNLLATGYENWPNATDAYGFTALPAGMYLNDPEHSCSPAGPGCTGLWPPTRLWSVFWTSDDLGCNQGGRLDLYSDRVDDPHTDWVMETDYKHNGLSVRCIKNEE